MEPNTQPSASPASAPIKLSPHQSEALSAIQRFLSSADGIFILKGSAGTGKTTLVHAICQYLATEKISFKLTATTGRAAKVLSDKTAQPATTLHSILYVFDEVAGKDTTGADPWESETGQLYLNFGLRNSSIHEAHPKVIIVDEASMISHITQTGIHTATFGSGNLLADLLSYAGNSQIIFVGDACQLPPVAEASLSAALSLPYWQAIGKKAVQFELTEVVRQQQGNEILETAVYYRNSILQGEYAHLLSFPLPQARNVFATMGKQAFLDQYITLCRQHGIAESVAICHSNSQAYDLNKYIRRQLHNQYDLQPGELLMVVQNSSNVDLVNGDQVVVEAVSFDCERAGFSFYNIRVKSVFNGAVSETKIIRNLLYNSNPGLTPDESKNLIKDFDRRMKNRNIARNSALYKDEMIKDVYLNALRAKFGYAITVHKAQGGEWKAVFLYLNASIYTMAYSKIDGPDKFHRWFYTAVTRASQMLVVNDCPMVVSFAHRHPEEFEAYRKEQQRKQHKPSRQR